MGCSFLLPQGGVPERGFGSEGEGGASIRVGWVGGVPPPSPPSSVPPPPDGEEQDSPLDNGPSSANSQFVPYVSRRPWSTRVARVLRQQMTEPELLLWSCLRHDFSWKFRRQELIDRYVVDFVCYPKRLIIEVDGIQHADSESDRTRDARLEELGFKVLRFWNGDVMTELDVVLETIDGILRSRPDLHPNRAPRQRRSPR